MKIVVTNTVLSNSGDAAIFEGILEALKADHRDVSDDLVIFDSNAERTQKLYPFLDIRQQYVYPVASRWSFLQKVRKVTRLAILFLLEMIPPVLREAILRGVSAVFGHSDLARTYDGYARADLVISSGGTYLVDHYNFKPRVAELGFAKSIGAGQVVLWTQSVGPFDTAKSHRDVRRLGKYVDRVHFRDKRSHDSWMAAVNSGGGFATVNADAAFMLTPPSDVEGRRDQVIFSVRAWNTGLDGSDFDAKEYESAYRACAAKMVSQAYHPVALSTCQGLPGYNIDDSTVAARIFDGTSTRIDRLHRSPDELMSEIKKSSLVVTTRMHLAILALVCRVPVIAVAYEFKTIDLFSSVGLGDCAVPIEELTETWLNRQVDRVLAEPHLWTLSESQVSDLRASAYVPAIGIV